MSPRMTEEQIQAAVDWIVNERHMRKPNPEKMTGSEEYAYRVNGIDKYNLDKEIDEELKEVWE